MPSVADPLEVSEPDDLYSVPLERFVEARDRLAARLTADGQTDAAASVAKLRKPSVAAWALNRASRQRPEAVERLVASHRRLRAAGSSASLREASNERRKAVAELESVAVAVLAADGRPTSGPTRDRIASTLLAVATDPSAEEDLAAGRLVREIEPSGEGWGDSGLAPPPAPAPADRARAAAQRARAEADRLSELAESAAHRVELARRALRDATRMAKEARTRADRAVVEAEKIERELRP